MSARYTMGIDLGGTTTSLAVIDARNYVAAKRSFPTRAEAGFDDVLRRISEAAAAALREHPCDALGVAAAAQVDVEAGVLVASPNLRFANEPLAARLRDALGLPVVLENDVSAAAYGEYLAAPQVREPLFAVFVGTGVGGGLVAGGDVFRGADGFAAEIGHVPVVATGGEPCGCGRRGCVEAYAGGSAIVRRANARRGPPPEVPAFTDVTGVARAAAAGEATCRAVLEEAADYLGVALAAAVNLLNPGTLVVGGGVARAWPPLAPRALERMKESALPPALASLATREALLGAWAGAIGAAALARKPARS
ncbi:MAG: ROK family protein [bacterium]